MDQARSHVLVNGEWVSMPLDSYHIIANARQDDVEMRDAPPRPTTQVPEYGILSQTVFATPMSKLILPANIRHKDLIDMVTIGEDCVHLKETRDHGHIRHVATKTDFSGGRIITAKIFGDPREVSGGKDVSLPLSEKHLGHWSRRTTMCEEETLLPPEVIVLTLSNRMLMFLWARHTHTGSAAFVQKTVRLPAGSSHFDRLGTFLAIDPKCRAIAVAAHEGRFVLYKTKPMEKWRREVGANGDLTTPIEDERIIAVQGQIMHMDFLSSGAGQDDFHVVLLLVIVLEGRTRLSCFDWDCRQDLSRVAPRTERYLVQYEDTMPSLLIPLRRNPDFVLVFDEHVSVYRNILSGDPTRTMVPMDPDVLLPLLPGDSKFRPRWTAWDKTQRNPDYPKEAFYLAREDGRTMYLVRGPAGTVEMNDVGAWSHRVDTAFACLSVDNSEFLIAGGAGNDGLFCKVGPWPTEYSYTEFPTNAFSYVQSMPNWTPLTDFAVTKPPSPHAPEERQRSSIFVANGSNPYGEISELRHGLQAIVDDSFSGINGCAGLWVVDHGSHVVDIEGRMQRQHYAIFAITLPPETLVIRIVRTQPESDMDFSGAWELGSWDKFQTPSDDDPLEDSLIREEETISACPWSNRISVQVARQEARTLLRSTLRQVDSLKFGTSLLLAASRPTCPFIVIAFREEGCTYLEVVRMSSGGIFQRSDAFRQQLTYDPTCVEILEIDSIPHIFVSTFDSKIMLFKHEDGKTSLVIEDCWQKDALSSSQRLCESVAILSSSTHQVLVCGMRDGTLLSTSFEMRGQDISSLFWRCTPMGATSAKITRSETDTASAFVSCGSDFCRVRCSGKESSHLEINSIWFTDRNHPEYNQSQVSAMYQLPFLQELNSVGRNLGGFLFVVAGDRLLFSQLDSDIRWSSDDTTTPFLNDAKAVPRKLLTVAKPTNILYMQKLRRVLVSTIEAKECRAPPHGERVLHSSIKLLKVRDDRPIYDTEVKQEDGEVLSDRLVVAQCTLKNAERVYSIVEWGFVNQQKKKYSLIIVGTGIQESSTKQRGRRLIFNAGKSGSKLELQKQSIYDEPVYSIGLWDNKTIVISIGKTLYIEQFDEEDGRWSQRGKTNLQSEGIHVSVNSPFVYVSTLGHSHMCFKVVDAERVGAFEFVREFSDNVVRNCSRHLVMEVSHASDGSHDDRFVLLTDKKSSSVTGIYQPPALTYSNASGTLFEACLPRSVVRIDRGDIRPPWRRSNPQDKTTGVIVDDIVGACTDGTIFAFSILSQPARHLLRLIQNLVETKRSRSSMHRHETVRPRSGDILRVLMNNAPGNQHGGIMIRDVDPRHLERSSQRGPKHKHVDGDLLKRWLSEDGNVGNLVCDDADAEIAALFKKLAFSVTESWGSNDSGNGVNKQLYEQVKIWMEQVLLSVL